MYECRTKQPKRRAAEQSTRRPRELSPPPRPLTLSELAPEAYEHQPSTSTAGNQENSSESKNAIAARREKAERDEKSHDGASVTKNADDRTEVSEEKFVLLLES